MPYLCCLLKLLNGSLVHASTFVDEMPSGGELARIHMASDHDIDVSLLFDHGGQFLSGRDSGAG